MTERVLRDVVDVESDIPPGMTIREWRRQRTAARPRSARRLANAARGLVAGADRVVARALARSRVARVRARGARYAAARSAAPSTLKVAP